ncbi:hypothetical protein [Marinobacterium sediminicola]|uniref:Uncharacterized protein n=1 Tax=Marinobacterium sediminicola TaxID=518898 RepID=A0ABY1RYL2_9GAMM|nr:hypothetical protein [Marinobacterium sediminicola]ULG68779.1 hypothetical protein LN244_13930 [Marinobacterium sediminicola]SMR73308.1 hypothetical protein SAMN04487964_103251 [Marinobacterium sediminicola]
MIWNLIATVVAGLGAAGIALILRSLSRKKLPKWIVPAFAGLGMLGYQIYIEYTWYDFKRQQLPENAEVLDVRNDSMIWRPWTYLYPMTVGFTVIDADSLRDTLVGDERVVEFVLYRFEKSYVDQVSHHAQLLNCASGEMFELDETRKPLLSSREMLSADSPVRVRVCP